MVILAVRTTRKLQTVSNAFVVNLSVCDLLFVTIVLPYFPDCITISPHN